MFKKLMIVSVLLATFAAAPVASAHDETQGSDYCQIGEVGVGCYDCNSTERYTDSNGNEHVHCIGDKQYCLVRAIICIPEGSEVNELAEAAAQEFGRSLP